MNTNSNTPASDSGSVSPSSQPEAEKGERLAKFLATAGIASRRSCEALITEGRVTVNGEAVTSPARNIDPSRDEVRFEGKVVRQLTQDRVYILLNKPAGYTCSAKDIHAKDLVYQLIPERFGRVFTVGRLDRDSEGLLILTNDGEFAQKLTHPAQHVFKRYYVECIGQFSTSIRRQLLDGMYDNGEFLKALEVEEKSVQRGHCVLIFTLGEGRKREIRRLCKDVGLTVTLLRRIAVGSLQLDAKLPVGSWRLMTPEELKLVTKPISLPPRAPNAPAPAIPRPYWQKPRREENGRPEHHGFGHEHGAHRGEAEAHSAAPARDGGERKPFFRKSAESAHPQHHPFGERPAYPQPQQGASEPRKPWYEQDSVAEKPAEAERPRPAAAKPDRKPWAGRPESPHPSAFQHGPGFHRPSFHRHEEDEAGDEDRGTPKPSPFRRGHKPPRTWR